LVQGDLFIEDVRVAVHRPFAFQLFLNKRLLGMFPITETPGGQSGQLQRPHVLFTSGLVGLTLFFFPAGKLTDTNYLERALDILYCFRVIYYNEKKRKEDIRVVNTRRWRGCYWLSSSTHFHHSLQKKSHKLDYLGRA